MARAKEPPASTLALDEYFEHGDPRFLTELYASAAEARFKRLAERWYADARPFARRALIEYIDDGCDRPRHRVLVKKLFKLAEESLDDECMAHFLVAFDRFPKRQIVRPRRRNPPPGTPPAMLRPDSSLPRTRDQARVAGRFTIRTRRYLARRTLRYLRMLGRADLPRFRTAARDALVLYRDEHLTDARQLLDAWGLLQLLYWSTDVLTRDVRGFRVARGRALAELTPAPLHPAAWQGQLDAMLDLLERARCNTVRNWALTVLKGAYTEAMRALPLARLRALLRSPHEEVQVFAVEFLRTAPGLARLTVPEWLELLRVESQAVLLVLCPLVEKHVHPERVSLAHCVQLACAPLAPVADLGLGWVRARAITTEPDLVAVLPLADARTPRVRAEGTAWLVATLERHPAARPEHLRGLLDARHADARGPALAHFAASPRFRDEVGLWSALTESPYDDARGFLVQHLEERARSLAPASLRHVWASALLAVHRGGAAKRAVVAQVAARAVKHPGEIPALVPLLAVALRSVRVPERRAALAALARAALASPALRLELALVVPEFKLSDEVAA